MSMITSHNTNQIPISGDPSHNSVNDLVERAGGRILKVTKEVSEAAGSHSFNLFKVNGAVNVIDAYAEIDAITTLNNLTNGRFYLDDGTATSDICLAGFVLSSVSVGTLILKTQDNTNEATVLDASTGLVLEADSSKKSHHPFVVIQKNGVDTYIKCSFTTTDDPVAFTISFYVVYKPINGGSLEVA